MSNFLLEGKLDQLFAAEFEELKEGAFSSGRRVFVLNAIKTKMDEIAFASKKDFNALYFYNQILSLKNLGFLSSQFSCASPITKRLKIVGGEIIYAVWKGNIYVTKVNAVVAEENQSLAGVYKVRKEAASEDSWAVDGNENGSDLKEGVDTKHLAINGFARGLSGAAIDMPVFIRYGHGTLGKVYSLFYNPSSSAVDSDWRSLKDTLGFTTQTAKKLADTLSLTASKNQKIQLTVHENGHALLRESLKLISYKNVKLDQFTVFYANPMQNLELVDVWRKRVGMKLAEKPPLVNSLSVRQNFLTGNVVSQPMVAYRAQPQNKSSIFYNAAGTMFGLGGLGSIGAGIFGVAGWALSIAPILCGQSRELNRKVIDSPGMAFQEGLKLTSEQSKKLVWDPIHKMMIKG